MVQRSWSASGLELPTSAEVGLRRSNPQDLSHMAAGAA